MQFVNRDGRMQRLPTAARFHPLAIRPFVIQVPHYRRGSRWLLVVHAEGIGLVADVSLMMGNDVELVERTLFDARNKAFPDSRGSFGFQLVRIVVPVVEASGDRNLAGIGSPDAKHGPYFAVEGRHVRPELVVGAIIPALVEEVKIVRGKQA